jgi:hypothetical protein
VGGGERPASVDLSGSRRGGKHGGGASRTRSTPGGGDHPGGVACSSRASRRPRHPPLRARRARLPRRPAPADRRAGAGSGPAVRLGLPAERHRLLGRGAGRPAHPLRRRARAGSRWAGGAGPGRQGPPERRRLRRGEEPRADRGDVRRPGRLQVEAGPQRGHRGAGLQELARQAEVGPCRPAQGLVAGQDLLRLSVSRGAPAP